MRSIKYLIYTAIFTFPFISLAQKGRLKYANEMYNQKAYYDASEAYLDVLDRGMDSSVVAVNIANSYDKMGKADAAVHWYKYIKRIGSINKNQTLRLALLERELDHYNESHALLQSYADKYGSNDIVNNILSSEDKVATLQKDNGMFTLKKQDINSTSSDMGVSFIDGNKVLFASSKREHWAANRKNSWTGGYFFNLYTAQLNAKGTIWDTKKVKSKTKYHCGPAAFNKKLGYIYFTSSNEKKVIHGNNKEKVLQIYRGKLTGNKITDVIALSKINSDDYSTTHPSISKDGTRLYFSSNRPGGMGGMDIYYVKLNKSGLPTGDPINLGKKVNTSGNELFPNFNTQSNLLFFSSNGHFGLGGLDVYVAKLTGKGTVKVIENLGSPINSSYDDFSFIDNEEQSFGYFSSNRPGGAGADDIYGFDQNEAINNGSFLKGNIENVITKNGLGNASVYIIDHNGKVIDSAKSNNKGNFKLSLNGVNDDFKLVANRKGFIKASKKIKYNPQKDGYEQNIRMMSDINYSFVGTIKDKETGSPIDGVEVTIYDQNKDNKKFNEVKTQNDGTFKSEDLPYQYKDHINYKFKLQKDGYVTKTIALGDILDQKSKINVSDYLSINMTKIEIGKTDLRDVVDINPIHFDLNKANIRPDAAKELNKVVNIMKDNPNIIIQLRAYTDQRGNNAYNRSLSNKRARSSARYIISRGISSDRISGKGYGEANPVVSMSKINKATSEEEKEALFQKNRRTEFIIVGMEK